MPRCTAVSYEYAWSLLQQVSALRAGDCSRLSLVPLSRFPAPLPPQAPGVSARSARGPWVCAASFSYISQARGVLGGNTTVAILPLFFLGAPWCARRQLTDPVQGSDLPLVGALKVATLAHPCMLPFQAAEPHQKRSCLGRHLQGGLVEIAQVDELYRPHHSHQHRDDADHKHYRADEQSTSQASLICVHHGFLILPWKIPIPPGTAHGGMPPPEARQGEPGIPSALSIFD